MNGSKRRVLPRPDRGPHAGRWGPAAEEELVSNNSPGRQGQFLQCVNQVLTFRRTPTGAANCIHLCRKRNETSSRQAYWITQTACEVSDLVSLTRSTRHALSKRAENSRNGSPCDTRVFDAAVFRISSSPHFSTTDWITMASHRWDALSDWARVSEQLRIEASSFEEPSENAVRCTGLPEANVVSFRTRSQTTIYPTWETWEYSIITILIPNLIQKRESTITPGICFILRRY